jgi:hypothetical protein
MKYHPKNLKTPVNIPNPENTRGAPESINIES